MSIIFKVFDTQLEFHDDLKKYYDLSCTFQAYHDKLYKAIHNSLTIKEEPTNVFNTVEADIKKFIGELINNLSNYGVFDRTVSDYLNENTGYVQLLNITTDYYEFAKNTTERNNVIAEANKQSASANIKSSVSGLDFGIISSSIIDHAVYSAMNNAEIRKQSLEAFDRMCAVCEVINTNRDNRISAEISEYYINRYTPAFVTALSVLCGQLLSIYANDLNSCGQLNLACLEHIDIQRSNEIISNIDKVDNKQGVFIKALELCPYNIEVYRKAYKDYLIRENKTLFDVCGSLIEYFNLQERLNNLLVSVEVLYDKANEKLERNDYKAAKEIYQEISDIYPQKYNGWLGLILCETKKFSMISPNIEKVQELYVKIKNTAENKEKFSLFDNVYNAYMNNNFKLKRLQKEVKEFDNNFFQEHKDVYGRDMTNRLIAAIISSIFSLGGLMGSLTDITYIPLFLLAICVACGTWYSLIKQDREMKQGNREKEECLEEYNTHIKELTYSISKGYNAFELL